MEYYMNPFAQHFTNAKDFGANLFAGDGVTIQVYHLKRLSSVMENQDSNVPANGHHVITYLILSGEMEFRLEDERVVVSAGNSISIYMDQNFTGWALQDSDFFSIHNTVERNVDNTPQDLVDAVKKVELADVYLQGHNYRVGKYSTLLMQVLAPERSTARFHIAAAYHDVGKVDVPEAILNKTGRLTPEEFDEIKKHPAATYEMMKVFIGKKAANFARWHHEKLDGSGYPDGLKGDEIPLESRVMAVADIFDALTTSRCYRKAFSFEKALTILREDVEAGRLDARVFEVLQHMVDTGVLREGVDNELKGDNAET